MFFVLGGVCLLLFILFKVYVFVLFRGVVCLWFCLLLCFLKVPPLLSLLFCLESISVQFHFTNRTMSAFIELMSLLSSR